MTNIMNGKFLRACKKKCRAAGRKIEPSGNPFYDCCKWARWAHEDEKPVVPKDVPKGHLAVYVGENQTRHVIKVNFLKNPIFRALLEQAREEYDYTADSRLFIPCDESMFLSVVQCTRSPPDCRCL
ncbi:SAUR-like auxin-responsive protein family [Striga hermonthica]|uniref:SAUR-like auxin-responsive protein family n=1 Tax=Striga hermonthica TaxID=68872 RepID=A0A9N7RJJ4_STRHE|nr:SAUR-like auxin-responsive protein family [Striga hermonthica]